MIWHIFKKDALLLWPFALTLAIAQAAGAALTIVIGYFHEPRELAIVANFYPFLVFLGIVVLTITVVHQEPLSGVREDWLMRPIFRRDLLLAKVAFAALMIHAPIFFIDVAEQIIFGFSLADSIEAAASRGVGLLCSLTLPSLLLGAVTASLMEALLFGLVLGIGCTIAYLAVFIFVLKPPPLPTGILWIAAAMSEAVIVIGAALTLEYAYSRRQLLTARILGVLVVLGTLGIAGWLPIGPAFAIQQSVVRTSAERKHIELRFGATAQKSAVGGDPPHVSADGAGTRTASAADNPAVQRQNQFVDSSRSTTLVRLPLQINGLPGSSILFADQISARIIGSDGATVYQGVGVCVRVANGMGRACQGNALEVDERPSDAAERHVEQQLLLPAATYGKLKDRLVTLELDYALTLLTPGPPQTMATIGDRRHVPGLGSCATRIDADGDEVELRCLSPDAPPSCATAFLDDSKSGLRNPEMHACGPNYVPFPQSGLLDVLNSFGVSLPFRDLSGLAHYPIDGAKIQSARVSFVAYHPTDHFRRTLVIPNIRLVDWEATRSQMRAVTVGH